MHSQQQLNHSAPAKAVSGVSLCQAHLGVRGVPQDPMQHALHIRSQIVPLKMANGVSQQEVPVEVRGV